ncbi:hypothetical protein BCR36DRAFT_304366 [Piromyces finnis]|uniref:Uncharacterized protein n=1 Tax=Piromyces finnis TaxID=1754191 RepID=A0A1Y1UZ84_9FUNG|nr:hypothetical protein BCR36DRAFT_304366 [Piromyces finnis]|eukprot:ORX43271.1 hypothetical protein BCR36DRAFT_304366 [Piromyces finnis]
MALYEVYFEEPVQSKDKFVQFINLTIRFFTFIFIKLINIYTWPKLNTLINIENIVICPLSGTILFKKLSYISKNESIYIERGYITVLWSFINKAKTKKEKQMQLVSNFRDDEEKPSRVRVFAEGLEYYIYNNMAVYEDLKRILRRESNESVAVNVTNIGEYILPNKVNKDKLFKSLLPIYVEVNKGAVYIGSRDLPSILVADFNGMKVSYSVDTASSIFDYYMTKLNVDLIKPVVSIRANSDHINYRKNDINNFVNR